MTFLNCKKVILNRIQRGTLDVDSMKDKLDVFLLADRITEEEYNELIALMQDK